MDVEYDDDDEMERVKASQVQAVLLSELLAEELAAGQPVEQPAGLEFGVASSPRNAHQPQQSRRPLLHLLGPR